LAAQLGISSVPRDDHAHYIKHWIDVMKKDNRAIFTAAAKASEAARYLAGFLPKEVANAA
jgi:antirestriction protein ArdC